MSKEEKIVTRTFQYGNEKEAEWPPRYGTGGGGRFYWDTESQSFKEGNPPSKIKAYGQAPAVIQDTIDRYYHPAAQVYTESRSELRLLDKMCGTITTDKHIPPDPSAQRARDRQLKKERTEALHKAVQMVDAGTAPLSEETRAKCEITNRVVSDALGMDAFNAVGRISDPRGKRYKRLKRRKKPTA